MIEFTQSELNAIAVMVANAPIAGKDAKFVASLLDKIESAMKEAKEEG